MTDDEGRRALGEQVGALEALRTRAVALLGIVGAVAALFAPSQTWAILTTAVLVALVVGVVVFLLLPKPFSTNTGADPLAWAPMTSAAFLTEMALHLHAASLEREATLATLQRAYVVSVGATGAAVLVLLVAHL